MKYKLTEKAKAMEISDFAINYGVNIKEAIKAFQTGEVEIDEVYTSTAMIKDGALEKMKIKILNTKDGE